MNDNRKTMKVNVGGSHVVKKSDKKTVKKSSEKSETKPKGKDNVS